MARNSIQDLFRSISGASFLIVLIGILTFLYAQTFTSSALFPQDIDKWNKVLTYYIVTLAIAGIGIIAIVPNILKKLAQANYWKSFFLRFIPAFLVSTIILILIKGIIKGTGSLNIFESISYIPISVLILHLFVVSQVEEILFGGLFYTAIDSRYGSFSANAITSVTFALFHFAASGGNWIMMITYIPLRLGFNYVRNNGIPLLNNAPVVSRFFQATPQTQQANAGVHFAWNFFIIAFIKPLQ